MLREPSFPAEEFEPLRQQRLASLEEQRSDPIALASVAFQRHMSPQERGDVRYVKTIDESIADLKAVTLDDVKKFHADFYGASHGELAVAGDFEADGDPGAGRRACSTAGRRRSRTRASAIPSRTSRRSISRSKPRQGERVLHRRA